MTIKTKDGLTLELPDNAEVQIDGDKITVRPMQTQPMPAVYPWWWANPYPYQIVYGSLPGNHSTVHIPACDIPQTTGISWTATTNADANCPYMYVQTDDGTFKPQ